MNFTYTLIRPPDGHYGSLQPDGSWSGMIRQLADEEADIAPVPFTITESRSTAVTFASPINMIYRSLFIKNPAESFNYTAYIEPIHWSGWVAILVMIFVVPPLLFTGVR